MKLKDFLKSTKYKINDGFEYLWSCYGENVFSIGRESCVRGKFTYSTGCIFDTKTQNVYEVNFWDYKKRKVFRWIKKSYLKKYKAEARSRNVSFHKASDEMDYEDIEFNKIISLINKAFK
jgi:hypothetical protein